jgi:glycosyl-4,4'-diaponeurosporenoate acyltransferase
VPDAGAVFDRTASKRSVGGRSANAIDRYLVETRRAEYVHLALPLLTPAFAWWNPWPLVVAMAGYAIAANAPCIAIQRYNRARILRVVARRDGRARSLR